MVPPVSASNDPLVGQCQDGVGGGTVGVAAVLLVQRPGDTATARTPVLRVGRERGGSHSADYIPNYCYVNALTMNPVSLTHQRGVGESLLHQVPGQRTVNQRE